MQQDIWIVNADGIGTRILAPGRNPVISPSGSTIAYILDDQIWTLDLRDPSAKPSQPFHGRGWPRSLA